MIFSASAALPSAPGYIEIRTGYNNVKLLSIEISYNGAINTTLGMCQFGDTSTITPGVPLYRELFVCEENPNITSGTILHTSFTEFPTVKTPMYRRLMPSNSGGSIMMFTFPNGLVIPQNSGKVLYLMHSQQSKACVSVIIDE